MKKNVTITLYMSEIVYDIQNKTYLKGRSKTEIDAAKRAHMQANDDDENLNQLLRSIGNAYGSLKSELSEYVVEGTDANATGTVTLSGNNILQPDEDIIVVLAMPSNFNEAAVQVISTGLHKYIVNTATADWYDLTSPDDAKTYLAQATANMQEVHNGIFKRVRPERGETPTNTENSNEGQQNQDSNPDI